MTTPPGYSNQSIHYANAPARSGMAITSMILGIVGIVTGCFGVGLILGIVGLILGIVALGNINRQPQVYAGKGFAITGIVTGILALILPIPLLIAILLPSLGRARELSNRAACGANLRGANIYLDILMHHALTGDRPDA